MADADLTAPNLSAASEADARLELVERHLCRMAGAARVLRALSDNYDLADDEGGPRRLLEALEYVAGSLSRDINSAVDVCDRMQPVEKLRRKWDSATA